MKIIVSGSLAYDRIMDFPGKFSDYIIPEKINELNVAFHVNGMDEKYGGTAGNIAYTLALMGEKPILSASIGLDYHHYFKWLEDHGIDTDVITIIEKEFTAGAYITTDRSNNQITIWNPGAMNHSSNLDFDNLVPSETLLTVSPGNLEDMMRYPVICKERGIRYIFDPGQSLPMLEERGLLQAIDGCHILICNDYELNLIMNKTKSDTEDLLKKAEIVIVTLGESGSKVMTQDNVINIPAAGVKVAVDPTGAGDAYRGGLISGLLRGKNLETAAKMGSVCASFAVECSGTQEFKFTQKDFEKRLHRL